MTNPKEILTLITPIWRQYCGVSDEYRTVRDRWLFLSNEMGRALPKLKKNRKKERNMTFDYLDDLVEIMDDAFKTIGLHRDEPEDTSRILQKLTDVDLETVKLITAAFFTLSTYTGLIKHAYFQRTVSLEIPQLESSLPSSPERTMGNETFHIAADKVGKKYSQCINKKYADWDGFITFSPAIGQDYFYGAFCKPTRELRLFHISVSEEQKYYLSGYLAIAHEFGHAAIASNSKYTRPPDWFIFLFDAALRETVRIQKTRRRAKRCVGCKLNVVRNLEKGGSRKTRQETDDWQDIASRRFFVETFEDFVADIIAYEIGGINTMKVLLEFAPAVEICYIRAYGLLAYLCLKKPVDPAVVKLFEKLHLALEEIRAKPPGHVRSLRCLDCWKNVGVIWGQSVMKMKPSFEQTLKEVVKDRFQCAYTAGEGRRVRKGLIQGHAVCDADPRIILHEYYDLMSQGKAPNYSATVYSLVMNETLK